ncbi:MAG: hypothetical protein ACRCWQ_07815 [Bacilli bacterium]
MKIFTYDQIPSKVLWRKSIQVEPRAEEVFNCPERRAKLSGVVIRPPHKVRAKSDKNLYQKLVEVTF